MMNNDNQCDTALQWRGSLLFPFDSNWHSERGMCGNCIIMTRKASLACLPMLLVFEFFSPILFLILFFHIKFFDFTQSLRWKQVHTL